ncbi:hypothetical protein BD626DRAFT_484090 [Schizophyllum amplum]|uniref:Uncharacterized protein n=1 Tax=Schizophyllum amplum TaxID=97359 RepID=A0A550CQ66_9AGAR|nr:hypothetical protein BD626DRAFT_484090 [Auriculariopsis ampla]
MLCTHESCVYSAYYEKRRKSASEVANEKVDAPGDAAEIFIDRLAASISWPPWHEIPEKWDSKDVFELINKALLLPVLFRIPDEAELAPYTLDDDDLAALRRLLDLNAHEQELRRQVPRCSKLTDVTDNVNRLLLSHAHRVCTVVKEARIRLSANRKLNEAEARIYWDEILAIIVIYADSFSIDTIFERDTPQARNNFLDKVTADMNLITVRTLYGEESSNISEAMLLLLAERVPEKKNTASASLRGYVSEFIQQNNDLLQVGLSKQNALQTKAKTKWTDDSQTQLDIEARVLRTHRYGRIDAGGMLSIHDIFPKQDIDRVKQFSYVTSLVAPNTTAAQADHAALLPHAPAPVGVKSFLDAAQERNPQVSIGDEKREAKPSRSTKAQPKPNRASPQPQPSSKPSAGPDLPSQLLPLLVLFLSIQYKQPGQDFAQVLNQARMDLLSNTKHLGTIGLYKLPVYALAIVGFRGYLLSAWGKPDPRDKTITRVRIVDYNCPSWDISDTAQALRLSLFLLNLREGWCALLMKKFLDVKEDFLRRWSSNDPAFNWKLEHQLKEQPAATFRTKVEASSQTVEELGSTLRTRMAQVKAERRRAKGSIAEEAES